MNTTTLCLKCSQSQVTFNSVIHEQLQFSLETFLDKRNTPKPIAHESILYKESLKRYVTLPFQKQPDIRLFSFAKTFLQ